MRYHPMGVRAVVKVHVRIIAKGVVLKTVAKVTVVVLALVHAVVRTNDNKTSVIMDKKTITEKFQTRREFFKKTANGVLPIIAGITLTGCETFLTAFGERLSSYGSGSGGDYGGGSGGGYSESSGCGYTCSSGCSGGCEGTCRWGCENTCKGSCEGTSLVKHWGN